MNNATNTESARVLMTPADEMAELARTGDWGKLEADCRRLGVERGRAEADANAGRNAEMRLQRAWRLRDELLGIVSDALDPDRLAAARQKLSDVMIELDVARGRGEAARAESQKLLDEFRARAAAELREFEEKHQVSVVGDRLVTPGGAPAADKAGVLALLGDLRRRHAEEEETHRTGLELVNALANDAIEKVSARRLECLAEVRAAAREDLEFGFLWLRLLTWPFDQLHREIAAGRQAAAHAAVLGKEIELRVRSAVEAAIAKP